MGSPVSNSCGLPQDVYLGRRTKLAAAAADSHAPVISARCNRRRSPNDPIDIPCGLGYTGNVKGATSRSAGPDNLSERRESEPWPTDLVHCARPKTGGL